MFEKIKAWLRGEDDVIRSVEDLQKAVPDLKIFVLPELPKEPDLKIYKPEEEGE